MSEHDQQVSVIKWFELQYPQLAPLLMAYPSGFVAGGKNKFALINKLKREGWRKGVPDLFLAIPRNGKAGLWIEMKDTKGKPSPEQIEYLELLHEIGYETALCYGGEEAIKVLSDYMQLAQ